MCELIPDVRLTPREVEHVALLSRLYLTPEEKETLGAQLSAMLEHFEQLRQLDVEGVPPTSHAIPLQNVMREDKPHGCSLAPEEVLTNAPDEEGQAFRVPRVVE